MFRESADQQRRQRQEYKTYNKTMQEKKPFKPADLPEYVPTSQRGIYDQYTDMMESTAVSYTHLTLPTKA